MNLQDVARALGGEVSGHQVTAPGPGHNPRDRSLSIHLDSDAPDGFVVHSFSGDDAIVCRDYVRAKVGLPPWEPKKANGAHPPVKRATKVIEYVYRLADGVPYLRVTRMSDKGFLQAHWTGAEWSNGKPAGPKIPYRLPEILAEADSPVFVVEGEKDADLLTSLGLVATTSSEGAGKWTDDISAHLTGRDVFVIPDNDDPGRRHAAQIMASLPGARRIDLGLTAKGADVSDWIAQGHTAAELLAIAMAPPVEAEPAPPSPLAPTPFVWTDPADIPRREWLYGRHLIRRYVSTTISPGGIGKSSLLMAEAVAMVTGRKLLGESVQGKLRVWYWNGEDDQEENKRRIAAICSEHRVTPDQLGDRLFLDTGREKDILLATSDARGFSLNMTALENIEHEIIANKIDVLIIDPFISAHNVGENDNMAINGVIRALARIAEHARCSIELVHHVRKPGAGVTADTDVNDARGASALIGGVRSARVLNVMSKDEAERLGIEDRFQYFHVDNGKSNLAPRSDKFVWRRIVSVDLGNGGDDGSDHVGVVTEWEMPGAFADLPRDIISTVQAAVRVGQYRYDPKSSDWLGHFLGRTTNIDSTEAAGRKRLQSIIDMWVKNKVLLKEMRPDAYRMTKAFLIVGEEISDANYE